MLDVRHVIGLDLGQVSDHTALVALRREQEVLELPGGPEVVSFPNPARVVQVLEAPPSASKFPPAVRGPARYYCNVAERFHAVPGEPFYPQVVDKVVKLFRDPRFCGQTLVVDGTGVGRPVVDLFRKARIDCRLVPVTITGGGAAMTIGQVRVDDWGYWHVPKKELVGSVQVLLGTARLEVAPGLTHASTLVRELKSFSYKINAQTAYVSLEAWRERDHDDLVLALALAAWRGERARQELWVL